MTATDRPLPVLVRPDEAQHRDSGTPTAGSILRDTGAPASCGGGEVGFAIMGNGGRSDAHLWARFEETVARIEMDHQADKAILRGTICRLERENRDLRKSLNESVLWSAVRLLRHLRTRGAALRPGKN